MRRRTRDEKFAVKAMDDIEGAYAALMCALGDRLGLFRDLKAHGPATSAELASRAGLDGRYTREWLNALAGAGYLDYDDHTARFALPPEHAQVLAEEVIPPSWGPCIANSHSWQPDSSVWPAPFARATAFQWQTTTGVCGKRWNGRIAPGARATPGPIG